MGRQLTGEQWTALFETYRYTARRLEPRDCYNTDPSPELLRRFLAGGQVDYSFMDTWAGRVNRWRAEGKWMARVRVVTEPLTADARFSLHAARLNVTAGEEIRYLPRQRSVELRLDLPDEDYWVFDATTAAIIHFDDDDRPVGHELIDDPALILQRLRWFDAAWHYSVSREEFAARHGVD
ncbi:MAG: hypothetical protein M3R63_19200 [Actinomycetota bacterium]|nr:hypothetical protein [Actinomycetota bacterium]